MMTTRRAMSRPFAICIRGDADHDDLIVGVIVAEMLGAAEGLGFLITRYRTLLNSPGVYAGIILVLVMTGVHEVLLRRLERMVASYREA